MIASVGPSYQRTGGTVDLTKYDLNNLSFCIGDITAQNGNQYWKNFGPLQ